MKFLPNRYVSFPRLIPTLPGAFGELVPFEEWASFWLWASPRLLGWSRNVNWLSSSPIDSRRKRGGGLVGIDSGGSLIIVDTKIDRGTAPDPFANFVPDIKRAATNRDWTAEALRAKWRKCSARDWLDRDSLRRAQLSYCAAVAPLLEAGSYEKSVERYLDAREDFGNPPPVFIGLVASTRSHFSLSRKALKNVMYLEKHVGRERVALRVISATLGSRVYRIQCRTPGNTEAAVAGALR